MPIEFVQSMWASEFLQMDNADECDIRESNNAFVTPR